MLWAGYQIECQHKRRGEIVLRRRPIQHSGIVELLLNRPKNDPPNVECRMYHRSSVLHPPGVISVCLSMARSYYPIIDL